MSTNDSVWNGRDGTAGGAAFGSALSALAAEQEVAAGRLAEALYFLPEGPTRYDARIYMREINPRHAVPENDMTKRNPTLKALLADELLDPLGRSEVEMAYLLRAAVQDTNGVL